MNGEPGDIITHQHGLHQGDPLSPMLFIIVMDVLNSLFMKAGEVGLLRPLSARATNHRISLYADDVALFTKPVENELHVTKLILDHFGEASGLWTNLQKSCVIPIQCDQQVQQLVEDSLECPTKGFPCTYLGMPISHKKLRKADLLAWVEKVADKLPGWKASLLNLAGRAALVRFVLSAIPIYILFAMNVPKWFIKAIDKIRRSFLWKGRREANGGCCLVAWEKVQRPLDLGGLGILNLEIASWALQMKWLWLQKTTSDRPWSGLEIPTHPHARAMFAISIVTQVGNGRDTLFWTDKWLHGSALPDIAPEVFMHVPKRLTNVRIVEQALTDRTWVRDIQGGLSIYGLIEYLILWDLIEEFILTNEVDRHCWKHDNSGIFSSKSAYKLFFNGSITFEPWRHLWKSWAPPKCKMFLWLAIRNKCWTADQIAKRGLDHPVSCVLCDQEEETVQHILVGCVFAREFWYILFQAVHFQQLAPRSNEKDFASWW
ncbi:hypothetical protein PR202_ga02745 [Eleusine coracana subsp. coracana]|uniref:Reverse transcriptase domain-containing protein n=1 Tax=Eleusine coracana subsp. coracana TaxID=191504 RepID=A0AAV5BN36_ELECO|nr:hypothetical protein PR202_ga02745 [Eleusine coracana subsp. coracana]